MKSKHQQTKFILTEPGCSEEKPGTADMKNLSQIPVVDLVTGKGNTLTAVYPLTQPSQGVTTKTDGDTQLFNNMAFQKPSSEVQLLSY